MTDDQLPKQPSGRDKLNRFVGLYAYAAAVLLTAFIAWSIFDTLKSRGLAGLKQDISTMAIFVAAAVVMFAIGYTTTGRRLS